MNPVSEPFCADCNRIRITSDGNTVRGLAIREFRRGIVLDGTGAKANRIIGNWVGITGGGARQSSTGQYGILINTGANEVGAELIVMGTHGRTGLNRLLMGSVAEQIVRRAPCPVLTVKLPVAAPVAAAPKEEERPLMATPY